MTATKNMFENFIMNILPVRCRMPERVYGEGLIVLAQEYALIIYWYYAASPFLKISTRRKEQPGYIYLRH